MRGIDLCIFSKGQIDAAAVQWVLLLTQPLNVWPASFAASKPCLCLGLLFTRGMKTRVCVCVCVHGEARGQHCVSSSSPLHYIFWGRVSQWTWSSSTQLGRQTSPRSTISISQMMGLQTCVTAFHVGAVALNLGPSVYTANILPTEPFLQPQSPLL